MALKVVCLNTGDRYGDEYVSRLYSMVQRNISEPIEFICYTDRARVLPAEIEQRSTRGWGTNSSPCVQGEVASERSEDDGGGLGPNSGEVPPSPCKQGGEFSPSPREGEVAPQSGVGGGNTEIPPSPTASGLPPLGGEDFSSAGPSQDLGWFGKLKLFDRAELPDEFLFFDLALVIYRSLDPMLEWARQNPEPCLIGMRDWNYDCFGSMVMWVRPCDLTQRIWDSYASGTRYPHQTPVDGDQDFIDGFIREHFRGEDAYFPQEWFVSYKLLRKAHADNKPKEKTMFEAGRILKFHGPPKMHELLDWKQNLRLLLKHKPFRTFSYWRYLEKQVREWWA